MGLYSSKQLETTFHKFCEKLLHITFNASKMCCLLSQTRRPASADRTARRQFQATGQPV